MRGGYREQTTQAILLAGAVANGMGDARGVKVEGRLWFPSRGACSPPVARQDCIKTDIRGKTSTLQQLYIRGNQIVFCIVPDMLRNAPMFARIKQWRKYKGHPPVLAAEGAKGQRAAILRKGEPRRENFRWQQHGSRRMLGMLPPERGVPSIPVSSWHSGRRGQTVATPRKYMI